MPINDCLKDVLDKAWEEKDLKEILAASPAALQGLSDGDAEKLQAAFGIKTVADMATNKYFLWAQAILTLSKV
jgi:hypothetical protein